MHKEFKSAGAEVLVSSGQACVLYGVAAFSKDGDWIIRESRKSFEAVLNVLEQKKASYRLGMPLDIRFLQKGLTSYFEYYDENGFRMRVDFVSRPPRVPDIEGMWDCALHRQDIDVVDVENLVLLKQTRRVRDYNVIGALAEVCGLQMDRPELAMKYLQDYGLLKDAVQKWPDHAVRSERKAIQLILTGAPRSDVVSSLAVEQDAMVQLDEKRIQNMREKSIDFRYTFERMKKNWKQEDATFRNQHEQLTAMAKEYFGES